MFEAVPLTEHNSVVDVWIDEVSEELKVPTDSDVTDITRDRRYLLVQVETLKGEVTNNHNNQNTRRESLRTELSARIGGHDDRIRELELRDARAEGKEESLEDFKKRLAEVERTFNRVLMIVSLIAIAAGGAASKFLLP